MAVVSVFATNEDGWDEITVWCDRPAFKKPNVVSQMFRHSWILETGFEPVILSPDRLKITRITVC